MKKMYFIVMVVGDSQRYVATTNDIEEGGSVDATLVDNFAFHTKEEAEKTMKHLSEYCKIRGYVNVEFYIEEL